MFYASIVTDNIHDMTLYEEAELLGPFKTKAARKKALEAEFAERDPDYANIHVTELHITPSNKLIKDANYVPNLYDFG
jgi:hypothetical protein